MTTPFIKEIRCDECNTTMTEMHNRGLKWLLYTCNRCYKSVRIELDYE